MSLIAKERGAGSIDPIPEGTYPAVCYSVVDLGTHDNQFGRAVPKLLVQWEVPDERITVERDGKDVDLPRAISRWYTVSLHEKANLRHDLESWRGKAFTQDELDGFNVGSIVGASCLLGIVHNIGADKKVYANVSSVLALPRGQARLKPENPVMAFAIPDDTKAGFDIPEEIPEWIRDIIMDSREYKGLMDWQLAEAALNEEAARGGVDETGGAVEDDDNMQF